MKIAAFEVREDERAFFEQLQREKPVEILLFDQTLTLQNAALAKGCQGVTTLGQSIFNHDLLDALKAQGCEYICTRTIGYNHIDIAYANQLGMRVANASYAPNGVADYAVMLMLMSIRNYKQALFRGNANDYSLSGLQGKEMRSLTVGVIGTGRIGRAVIQNLSGFGCKMLAYDAYPSDDIKDKVEYVPLETLYARSDMITLHTPLFDSTYHMINRESLQKMKDGVVLINTARGELMDVEALVWGIESKKIGALGLDVIEHEEGIYHCDRRSDIIRNRNMAYIRQFPNVTMTQHIAFYTDQAVKSMVQCGVQNILDFAQQGRCPMEVGKPA